MAGKQTTSWHRILLGVIVISVPTTCGCSSDWMGKFSPKPIWGQAEDSVQLDAAMPQGLVIWHDSWEAAVAASRASGKPILADFTGSDWCSWCVKLKRDVFDTPEFQSWAAENVVLLELDYPRKGSQPAEIRQQNERLKQRYQISSYPTVLLLNADGDVLGKLGYQSSPTQWIAQASESLTRNNEANRFQPGEFSSSWQ